MRRTRAGVLAGVLALVVGAGGVVAVTRGGAGEPGDIGSRAGVATSTTAGPGATTSPGSGAGSGTGSGAAPSPSQRPGVGTVVVLGDSYSAGNGAGGATGACYRSRGSAAHLYAAAVRARLVDASCSGAVVSDLVSPDRAGNPAQDSVVDRQADVVVLTMGGNDVGFADIVTQCFLLASGTRPGGCSDAVARARSALPAVESELTAALVTVRSRMRPGAVLVLRAYPLLAPDRPYVQRGGYDANAGVRALGADGVAMQRRVVAAVRARLPGGAGARTYLDTSALRVFAGHELGAGGGSSATRGTSAVPWFAGFQTPGADTEDVYHPNALGQAAWAQSLETFLAPLTR